MENTGYFDYDKIIVPKKNLYNWSFFNAAANIQGTQFYPGIYEKIFSLMKCFPLQKSGVPKLWNTF